MLPQDLKQLELFTTHDAVSAGLGVRDLARALRSGELHRLKRSWFTAAGSLDDRCRHLLRLEAELRDHPSTVPSHVSAAAYLDLPLHRPNWAVVHLMRTTSGRSQTRSGVVLHPRVGDAALLVPALVCVQVALTCEVSGLMALDAALRRGLTTKGDFAEWASRIGNLAGKGHLLPVATLGNGLRESPLESRTALTYDRWGFQLDPQFVVPGTRFRADARIRGTRVLVESDGVGKYQAQSDLHAEKVREDELRVLGWEVIRVTSELLDRPAVLLARTRAALACGERQQSAA